MALYLRLYSATRNVAIGKFKHASFVRLPSPPASFGLYLSTAETIMTVRLDESGRIPFDGRLFEDWAIIPVEEVVECAVVEPTQEMFGAPLHQMPETIRFFPPPIDTEERPWQMSIDVTNGNIETLRSRQQDYLPNARWRVEYV